MNYVHLHIYSHYSAGHSISTVDSIISRALEYNMESIALTDYHTMSGVIDFYHTALKRGVRPIPGAVIPVNPASLPDSDSQEGFFNVLLIARDRIGYHNILRILSGISKEKSVYGASWDLISRHSDSLVAISPQLSGDISRLAAINPEQAVKACEKYITLYKDNFYLELEDIGLQFQKERNEILYKLRSDVRCVVASRCSYTNADDAVCYEAMMGLIDNVTVSNSERRTSPSDELYIKSPEEIAQRFSLYPDAVSNSVDIASKCSVLFHSAKYSFPSFKESGGNSYRFLENKCKDALKVVKTDEEHKNRLDEELAVISQLGTADYFLILSDIIDAMRNNGHCIFLRGSIFSSYCAYLLKMMPVDPVEHGLYFEDFTTAHSEIIPDIEFDVSEAGRSFCERYIKEKYEHTASVRTFIRMGIRQALKDTGKYFEIPGKDIEEAVRVVESNISESIRSGKFTFSSNIHRQWLKTAAVFEGVIRSYSVNPGVIILSGTSIISRSPVEYTDNGLVSQYDLDSLQYMNFIKIHVNRSSYADIIEQCGDKNEQSCSCSDVLHKMTRHDYAMVHQGYFRGLPYIDTKYIQGIAEKMRPGTLLELAILCACAKSAVSRKHVEETFFNEYHANSGFVSAHVSLKKVLRKTWNQVIFIEQIAEIAEKCASMKRNRALSLKKCAYTKNFNKIFHIKDEFEKGLRKHRFSDDDIPMVYDLITELNFNASKSASLSRAVILASALYMKKHFFVEYMVRAMNVFNSRSFEFVNELQRKHKRILLPDVNKSGIYASCEEKAIRIGLSQIRQIGAVFASEIIAERKLGEFISFENFCRRIHFPSKKVLENLILCGSCDCFGWKRSEMMQLIDTAYEFRRNKSADPGQTSFLDLQKPPEGMGALEKPEKEEYDNAQLWDYERDILGFYHEKHPLIFYSKAIEKLSTLNCSEISSVHPAQAFIIGVLVKNIAERGEGENKVLYFTCEDLTGECTVQFSAENEYARAVKKGDCVLCKCSVIRGEHTTGRLHGLKIYEITKIFDILLFKVILYIDDVEHLEMLKEYLDSIPGNFPVFIELDSTDGKVLIDAGMQISMNHTVLKKIESLAGDGSVKFVRHESAEGEK